MIDVPGLHGLALTGASIPRTVALCTGVPGLRAETFDGRSALHLGSTSGVPRGAEAQPAQGPGEPAHYGEGMT